MKDNIAILLAISTCGVFVLVIFFILIYVRGRNRLLKKQNELHEAGLIHQQELLNAVIVSQESERSRIGQDLHDDVGTALSNLRLTIELFNHNGSTDIDKFTQNCKSLIDRIVSDVRHISHNLSPPGITQYGFFGALEELCEIMSKVDVLEIKLVNEANSFTEELNAIDAISLYRVIEELINNTIKHAGASQICIFFKELGDRVELIYTDNGYGLPQNLNPAKGLGMHNIESRLKLMKATILVPLQEHSGYCFRIGLHN